MARAVEGVSEACPAPRATAFGRLVRDALLHLHDLAYLQTHPLASRLADAPPVPPADRGRHLHHLLVTAIEDLRPAPGLRATAPAGRTHRLLHLRYVEALEIPEVCVRLGISQSQYHRAHGPCLDAIISLLAERHTATTHAAGRPARSGARHNLPIPVTSFIGRKRELAEVARLLAHTRLLTLTGAAGCGKTRLALEAAARSADAFPDGVWLVELAPLADPAPVPQAVAGALGVREEGGRPLAQTLAEAVGGQRLLLLLDNCEHLLEASARLADDLLRRCPELRLLATSREPLGLPGEVRWRVPSLPVPPPVTRGGIAGHRDIATGEAASVPASLRSLASALAPPAGENPSCIAASAEEGVQGYEAVQLFVDRATDVVPSFAVTADNAGLVADVCRRLDGIPLALELAAARLGGMSLGQLAARLDQRFQLLTGGSRAALPRHQTLAGLVGWSYDLLREPERQLFDRLAVFAGSFTPEAVEAVCGDGEDVLDLLARLVEKSLVILEDDAVGRGRYRLLETLRQYAREKLVARGEAPTIQARHAAYYLELAQENAGAKWAVANQRCLESELENLRAALRWAATSGDAERAMWLTGELADFWRLRGYPAEGRAWIDELLAISAAAGPTAGRGRALCAAATLAWQQDDLAGAQALLDGVLAIQRAIDDREGIARSLQCLGRVRLSQRDYAAARQSLEESLVLARELPEPGGVANGLHLLSLVAFAEERVGLAEQLGRKALAETPAGRPAARAVGHDWLGRLALARGDHAGARAHLTEALRLLCQADYLPGLATALGRLGDLAAAQGKNERAVRLAGAAARLCAQAGGIAARAADRPMPEGPGQAIAADSDALAWMVGQAMTLDEAIAYALAADDP